MIPTFWKADISYWFMAISFALFPRRYNRCSLRHLEYGESYTGDQYASSKLQFKK